MAITWSIVQLDYAVSLDGETDVVNNSHWQCIDEDASGNQARVYGSVGIPTDDIQILSRMQTSLRQRLLSGRKMLLVLKRLPPLRLTWRHNSRCLKTRGGKWYSVGGVTTTNT
jgi:hypothetical protein